MVINVRAALCSGSDSLMRLKGKRKTRILLLDDEEWELTTAQQTLQREGYT